MNKKKINLPVYFKLVYSYSIKYKKKVNKRSKKDQ